MWPFAPKQQNAFYAPNRRQIGNDSFLVVLALTLVRVELNECIKIRQKSASGKDGVGIITISDYESDCRITIVKITYRNTNDTASQ